MRVPASNFGGNGRMVESARAEAMGAKAPLALSLDRGIIL
jgi:hypothetical protein